MAEGQLQKEEALIRQFDRHNAVTLIKNDKMALKKYLAIDFLLNTSGNKISFAGESILSAICNGQIQCTI